jgi:hypothetical protein
MKQRAWRFFLGTQDLGRRRPCLQVVDQRQQIEQVLDADHGRLQLGRPR